MSAYLCQAQEVYHVTSEAEAAKTVETAKQDKRFTVLKSTVEYKPVKAKGELVDEYWKVTITKQFTDLKDPDCTVTVSYKVEDGVFPEPVSAEEE